MYSYLTVVKAYFIKTNGLNVGLDVILEKGVKMDFKYYLNIT